MKFIRANKNALFVLATVAILCLAVVAVAGLARPSQTSTAGSHHQLMTADGAFQNFVIDRPYLWIPVVPSDIVATALVGIGAGAPAIAEIGTSEVSAVLFDTDADSIASGLTPFPSDIDLAKNFQCRVLLSTAGAAAVGTVDFVLTYEVFVVGTTALTVANDAFDTDGGAQADLAAAVLTWGPWSVINGGTITATPGDDLFLIQAVYDETTTTDADFFGFQCQFYRKWLGAGND